MPPRGWIAVAPGGSDAAASAAPHGAPEAALAQPLATLAAALGRAGPGDAILLREGHYAENLEIRAATGRQDPAGPTLRALSAEAPLHILGLDGFDAAGRPRSSLAGAEARSTILAVGISHLRIHNLEILGHPDLLQARDEAPVKFIGAPGDAPPEAAAGWLTLAGCRIGGAGTDGVKAGKARHLSITGCSFDMAARSSMIDFVTVLDAQIRNCAFLGRAKDGASAKGASGRILWEANVFGYEADPCCGLGWRDPAITIGGIGWSRTDRDMPPDRWNVECFDSIARRNLFAGAFEHAVILWGARNCRVEENFVAHLGAPGRGRGPRHAWRAQTAPSYPWRNQWMAHAHGADLDWPRVQALGGGRLDRLGHAPSGGNRIAGNTFAAGAGLAQGFSAEARDPAAPNVVLPSAEGSEAAWRAAHGPVGPDPAAHGAIYAELGLAS